MKWAQNSNLLQVFFEFLLNFEVFAIFQVSFEFLHFTSRLAYFGVQTSSPAPAEPPKLRLVFRHGKWDSFVSERKRILHLGELLRHQRPLAPSRSHHFGCATGVETWILPGPSHLSLSPPSQGSVMPCATYKLRGWPPRPPPPRPQVACRRMLHHNIQSNRNALTLQFAITNVCSFKKKCICFAYSWTKDYFRENWRKILVSLIWLISFKNYFHGLQFFSDQVALTMPNLYPLKLPTVKRSSTLDSQLTRGNEQDHQLRMRRGPQYPSHMICHHQDVRSKIVTWNNNNN